MATWMEALRAWNAKSGGKWCIPKKGSAEYEEVRKLMGGAKPEKAEKPESAPKKKRMTEAEKKAARILEIVKEMKAAKEEAPKMKAAKEEAPKEDLEKTRLLFGKYMLEDRPDDKSKIAAFKAMVGKDGFKWRLRIQDKKYFVMATSFEIDGDYAPNEKGRVYLGSALEKLWKDLPLYERLTVRAVDRGKVAITIEFGALLPRATEKKFKALYAESQKSFENRLENLRKLKEELPDMLKRYKSLKAEAGLSDSDSDFLSDSDSDSD